LFSEKLLEKIKEKDTLVSRALQRALNAKNETARTGAL
jgi:post-segregation antitoxin (ccd killing protein)